MFSGTPAFENYLCEQLEQLNLEKEVFKDYVLGILRDETASAAEKEEIVKESLLLAVSEAGEQEAAVAAVAAAWVEKWEADFEAFISSRKFRGGAAAAAFADAIDAAASDAAAPAAATAGAQQRAAGKAKPAAAVSRLEHSLKQRLIDEFAWQVEETVDFDEASGALQLEQSGKKKPSADSEDASVAQLWKNENRARVQAAHQMQRQQAKAQHEEEMKRKAEQKKQELLKKEKEKQRVSKKERRSGR